MRVPVRWLALPALSLVVAALLPSSAGAQQPASFAPLGPLLRPGATVVVIDRLGNSTRGKVENLSDHLLRLKAPAAVREFMPADVLEVRERRRDQTCKTAKRGFFLGVGIGLAAGVVTASVSDWEEAPMAGVLGGAVYGTAIGAVVGVLKKSEVTIYRAAGVTQNRIRVTPFGSRSASGIAIHFTF